MAAFGRIGVREFVDDDQFRTPLQGAVEVEFLNRASLPFHLAARQDFEVADQPLGVGAPMRLDEADDDVDALLLEQPRALQHRIGLADARRGADKHQQAAALALFGQREQRVRVRSAFRIAIVGQWRPVRLPRIEL